MHILKECTGCGQLDEKRKLKKNDNNNDEADSIAYCRPNRRIESPIFEVRNGEDDDDGVKYQIRQSLLPLLSQEKTVGTNSNEGNRHRYRQGKDQKTSIKARNIFIRLSQIEVTQVVGEKNRDNTGGYQKHGAEDFHAFCSKTKLTTSHIVTQIEKGQKGQGTLQREKPIKWEESGTQSDDKCEGNQETTFVEHLLRDNLNEGTPIGEA